MELRGKVAVVTGGNGGLGQRICHALAREGVHLAVVYARSRDQAEGVARELADRHQIQATALPCDLEDPEAAEASILDLMSSLIWGLPPERASVRRRDRGGGWAAAPACARGARAWCRPR